MPVFEKSDRGARLMNTILLLMNQRRGLTVEEIARRNNVSKRTAQRDLNTLESSMGVPLYLERDRWILMDHYFLEPLDLELDEAVALFLSVRLLSRHTDAYDVHVGSAMSKLSARLPTPMREFVEATASELASHPRHPEQSRIFSMLASAWANQREVVIEYPSRGQVTRRAVRPYFIEPSMVGRATYLVGHDVDADALRTFKIERIRSIAPTEVTFKIPEDFDPGAYFAPAWGIMHADPVHVTLRFAPDAAARVRESRWHPTQKLEEETGGYLHFEVTVAGTVEILPWILGWGDSVEVLEPDDLRRRVADIARRTSTLYRYEAPLPTPVSGADAYLAELEDAAETDEGPV
ncbi:MAG: helix-turn-helix transcriptional regulator [Candidatus Dormibacteria bacterium]